MFRAVNDYMAKLNIVTDDAVRDKVQDFLDKSSKVDNFSINVN